MSQELTESGKIPVPLTNMAVSLSGGGYRATTFHLGALSYLDYRKHKDMPLLENVSIISTISGGTLTGVMYALKLAQGETFTDCFHKLYKLLSENNLVDLALEKLNKPDKWKNKYKTRDLINAFSEVYNEHFFDEATFSTLRNGKQTHLQDAVFGTSEFTTGLQFRLQKDEDGGRFGNRNLNIPDSAADEIRLADAAAASSCFPGGFEPMIMPADFDNGPDSTIEKAWFQKLATDDLYQETAIMDGGIIDNQGIEGVKKAEERRRRDSGSPYIGTFIISDVSSAKMAPYPVPKLKYGGLKNLFTLRRINSLVITLSLIIVLLLAMGFASFWGIVAGTVVLTLSAIWFIVYWLISEALTNQVVKMFSNAESPELLNHLKVLKKTPLYILIYLVKFRVTSVLKMVSDIFLRRIRALEISDLYESDQWNYRIKGNNIYTLEDDIKKLPKEMQAVISAANTMPTTLWWSEQDIAEMKQDNLIACGQFTMCSNLKRYIDTLREGHLKEKVWDHLDAIQQKDINELHTVLCEDWASFEKDPFWLLKQYKKS